MFDLNTISPPLNGIMQFTLHRDAYDDEILLDLGPRGSFLLGLDPLRLWMSVVGVHPAILEKVLDAIWNFRDLNFDMSEQRFTLP